MPLYDHMYTIAFSLRNASEGGENTTAAELISALKARIASLEKNPGEIIEACGMPDDTYEVDSQPGDIRIETHEPKRIILAEPGGDIKRIFIGRRGYIPDVMVDLNHENVEALELYDNKDFRSLVLHYLRMAGYEGKEFGRAELGLQGPSRVTYEPNDEFIQWARTIGWLDMQKIKKQMEEEADGIPFESIAADLRGDVNYRDMKRSLDCGDSDQATFEKQARDLWARKKAYEYEPQQAGSKPRPGR